MASSAGGGGGASSAGGGGGDRKSRQQLRRGEELLFSERISGVKQRQNELKKSELTVTCCPLFNFCHKISSS